MRTALQLVVIVAITILLLNLSLCCVRIYNTESETYNNPKVPASIMYQSSEAGDDNLLIKDPTKTSCSYYVTEKKNWHNLFNDFKDNIKAKYSISALSAARGIVPGSDAMTYFDGCVIPQDVVGYYGIDKQTCKYENTAFEMPETIQIIPTAPVVYPKGCLIDFSGLLGNRNVPVTSEDDFKKYLINAYDNMNAMDDVLISNLQKKVTAQENDIQTKQGEIINQQSHISSLELEKDKLKGKLDIATALVPSYFYLPSNKWVHPVSNTIIAKWSQLGIDNNTNMTITFWINIEEMSPSWRNVFHVSNGQNFYRRPSLFIVPNSKDFYISVDTDKVNNHFFPVAGIEGQSMIGLVWKNNILTIYINKNRVEAAEYVGLPLNASPDDLVYLSDPWHGAGGYAIRKLKFYNTAIDVDTFYEKYEKESPNTSNDEVYIPPGTFT